MNHTSSTAPAAVENSAPGKLISLKKTKADHVVDCIRDHAAQEH